MKTYLGTTGLNKTWQVSFPKTMKCHSCRAIARIMFVACEEKEKEYVCNLHKNKEGQYWPHDAIACAVYLCEKCFEPNAIINQA